MKKYKQRPTFVDSLQQIIAKAKESEEIEMRDIFTSLAGKGYASLFILCSLPFCLPIQIPGLSTPFGLILGFLGLRLAFAKRLWWPRWVLDKKVSSANVEKLAHKTIQAMQKMQKIVHPRLVFLTQHPIAHRLHGLLVFLLSLVLSLPLPIPFTNMLCALPIFFIGIGLLEDDGVAILIGYFLALVCLAVFISLFIFGKALIAQILQ